MITPNRKQFFWKVSHSIAVAMAIHSLLWPLRGIYARSDFGRDHLCAAAYSGHAGQMHFLLEAGADPSVVGWDDHLTPLGRAVEGQQVDAVRLLLQWGANPDTRDDFGNMAVKYVDDPGADELGRTVIVALLHNASRR